MNDRLKRLGPPLVFLLTSAVILGAVLALKPGWGFMDDFGLRQLAASFWGGESKWQALGTIFSDDVTYGRFRPVYFLWVLVFYGVFQSAPLMFNFFLTLAGLGCLLLWGKSLQLAYEDEDPRLLWLYPLFFFIFTPFWNMFMYLSIQERFYLIFGGLGFFCYLWAKRKSSVPWAAASCVFLFLLALGKETGVSIAAAVGFYSLLDLLFISREKKVNGAYLIAALLLGIPYVVFMATTVMGRGYSEEYSNRAVTMPLIVKGILLIGFGSILYYCYDRFITRKQRFKESLWLLFPLSLVFYLFLLLPWGYPTYMLAPVSLFLFGTLYLGARFFKAREKTAMYAVGTGLSLFVIAFNALPSIGVMADKSKVTDYVRTHLSGPESVVYFPPPYTESAESLASFSGANVIYVGQTLDQSRLNFNQANYLVMHLECGPVKIESGKTGADVYRNKTWSIQIIEPDPGQVNVVSPDFKVNFLKRLKKKVRSL